MFNGYINLENPMWNGEYEDIVLKHGKISGNKYWEFDVFKDSNLVSLGFHFTTKGDHAGVGFGIGLFGYSLGFAIYDNRHWDYENNKWEDTEEEISETENNK